MRHLRILILVFLLLLPAISHAYEGGDTGTYRILDYKVSLTPHDDGAVTIEYYQKWEVLQGHIPWVTIGTPDSDFYLDGFGANVAGAETANSGDWSGVRLDLDRDYQPGETFEVMCTVTDLQLICAYGDECRMEFTPGWYDRAAVDALQITFRCLTTVDLVTTDPEPMATSEGCLTWRRAALSPGDRFTISVVLPKAAVPSAQPPKDADTGDVDDTSIFFVLLVMVGVLYPIAVWIDRRTDRKRYTGGKIRRGGGGYHGGGYHCACACACAGCACACACAGGGGAGCSRKLRHRCPICRHAEPTSYRSVDDK